MLGAGAGSAAALPEAKPAIVPFDLRLRKAPFAIMDRADRLFDSLLLPPLFRTIIGSGSELPYSLAALLLSLSCGRKLCEGLEYSQERRTLQCTYGIGRQKLLLCCACAKKACDVNLGDGVGR